MPYKNYEQKKEKERQRYRTNPEPKKARAKAWYEDNRDRVRDRIRWYQLLKRYGITRTEFEEMLEQQEGKCAVCRVEFTHTPYVDHDHLTGVIRGLLDRRCNALVGFLEGLHVQEAQYYIERYKNNGR